MSYVLYGTETDGPYLVEVPNETAEAYATEVHGHVFETADDARDAWEGRGTEPLGPGTPDAAPTPEADAQAPTGDPNGTEVGSGDPTPEAASEGVTFGSETPAESSPSADRS